MFTHSRFQKVPRAPLLEEWAERDEQTHTLAVYIRGMIATNKYSDFFAGAKHGKAWHDNGSVGKKGGKKVG